MSDLENLLAVTLKGDLSGVIKCLHFLTPEEMHKLVDSAEKTNGDTCLIIAAREGHSEIVQYLIESDCNLDVTNSNNETAVVAATMAGHPEIANMLAAAWCDIVSETDPGTPQLIFYCLYNNPKMVTMLLDQYRCDVNAKSSEGFTALMAAATADDVDIMSILIDHGADIDMENIDGDNALLLSLAHDSLKAASFLLDRNCNCNHKSHDGDTPLMMCVVKGYIDIARAMLSMERGLVNLDDVNIDKLTALHMATMINNIDFIKLLLEYNANPLLESVAGETALDIAISKQYEEAAEILEAAVVTVIGGPNAVSSDVSKMLSKYEKKCDEVVSVASSKSKKKKKKSKADVIDNDVSNRVLLQISESALDEKIEQALSTQKEIFEKSLNDNAELLAAHMDERIDKNFKDIQAFIQNSMDNLLTSVQNSMSGKATSAVENEPLTRRNSSSRKAPLDTNREIDRSGLSKTIKNETMESMRETLMSVALAVENSKPETKELFEQGMLKMNQSIADVERRLQDAIQQLRKSMVRMFNEVNESNTTGMLSHSAEIALSASAAIDEKYHAGNTEVDSDLAVSNSNGASVNGHSSNNEIVKLLQQMRSDQLKAQRKYDADREDEMNSLRRQLNEYSAKLVHVEEELSWLKKQRSGKGSYPLPQQFEIQNDVSNAVEHPIKTVVSYEEGDVHDFSSPSKSRTVGMTEMSSSTSNSNTNSNKRGINPKIMGIHKSQNKKKIVKDTTRPLSPNTLDALAYLKEEAHHGTGRKGNHANNGYLPVQESNQNVHANLNVDVNDDVTDMLRRHGYMDLNMSNSAYSSNLLEASQLLSTPYIPLPDNSQKNAFGGHGVNRSSTRSNYLNTSNDGNRKSPAPTRRGRSSSPRAARFMENTDSSLTKTSLTIESLTRNARSKSPSSNGLDELASSKKPPMRFNQK